MKKLLILSTFCLALIAIQSCTKDDDDDNGDTSKTKEVLLTQHTWKMEEILQVENNTRIYYSRGGSMNTNNYDNDKITFLADGTGTYSPTVAQTLPITWAFTNA
ncbi:MAG TPA: hypothetical protein VK644_07485, partial [Chitinophagaceae bacterium]|nr:hypothetical protein [Chitinophagaceae bacterium]